VIVGAAVIGLGIYEKLNISDGISSLATSIQILPIIIIVFGVIVLLIALVGLCGAMQQSRILLGIYMLVLFLLMLGQIGLIVMGFVERGDIETGLQDAWNKLTPADINQIQDQFKCCGFLNGTCNSPQNATDPGCQQALINFLDPKIYIVIGAGFAMLLIEAFGILVSCCLFSDRPKRREDDEDYETNIYLDNAKRRRSQMQ